MRKIRGLAGIKILKKEITITETTAKKNETKKKPSSSVINQHHQQTHK